MTCYTIFKVVSGTTTIDSASTQQWLTADIALEKARALRDKFNASEYVAKGGTPARIVRAFRKNTAKPL